MKNFLGFSLVAVGLLSTPAMAWDAFPSGLIQQLDVTAGQNYGFRVVLADVSSYCNATTYDFAYLNETDSNYKTFVAALMMAKAAERRVTLYLTRENGACKIGYITVL